MIEIIKPGTKEKCTCKECGCIFTYEAEDVKLSGACLCEFGAEYSYVKCPQCNNQIHLVEIKK